MSAMTLDRPSLNRPFRSEAVHRPARAATVRLTRRGRLVVLAAALVIAFAIGVFVTAAGSVATQEPEPTKIVQVGSGDTLWGIASQLADEGETRAMMERIERLNALDSSVLQAGQRLVVPAQ